MNHEILKIKYTLSKNEIGIACASYSSRFIEHLITGTSLILNETLMNDNSVNNNAMDMDFWNRPWSLGPYWINIFVINDNVNFIILVN